MSWSSLSALAILRDETELAPGSKRSVQMLKRERGAESNGKYSTNPSLAKLQPGFLS